MRGGNGLYKDCRATELPCRRPIWSLGYNGMICYNIPMKNLLTSIPCLFTLAITLQAEAPAHLFILSGQSNMAGLNPAESFTPTVEAEFGKEKVIVVKSAKGGQPIRRWYKDWKPATGDAPPRNGDLYEVLLKSVRSAAGDRKLASVTFLWMQGEKDAREKHGDVYAESFQGILKQLQADLKREDINFVIGRLSDFDMKNARYPHWTNVRDAQVKLAEANPRGEWVDTDDLNDGKNRRGKEIKNDLHYSAEGYKVFGKRLADKAIGLIRQHAK